MHALFAFATAIGLICGVCALYAGAAVGGVKLLATVGLDNEPAAICIVWLLALAGTIWLCRFIVLNLRPRARG